VLGDQNGVIRDFQPYECATTQSGIRPLYSAALLAYQFAERDRSTLDRARARHWVPDGATHCQDHPFVPVTRGERIDYHLSLDLGFAQRVWPDLPSDWPGFKQCHGDDTSIFRRISVIDIHRALAAGTEVNSSILCQHIVMIGGTSTSGGDFVQTPLNEMQGSMVLANAIRGLELTHGGLRSIPLPIQVVGLALFSALMSTLAVATQNARHRYRGLQSGRHKRRLSQRLGIIGLNPIILNGSIAFAAHTIGILILALSLEFGVWGFLSAPVFAAAITETIQEFFDG
jgi:hypothetical protein